MRGTVVAVHAHRITEFGEPSVLGLVEVDEPVCGPHDLLVEHDHIGVNFVDTQHRREPRTRSSSR
jgi:NADPH:quinone reductase-like Zn-dependent oxidoreductase